MWTKEKSVGGEESSVSICVWHKVYHHFSQERGTEFTNFVSNVKINRTNNPLLIYTTALDNQEKPSVWLQLLKHDPITFPRTCYPKLLSSPVHGLLHPKQQPHFCQQSLHTAVCRCGPKRHYTDDELSSPPTDSSWGNGEAETILFYLPEI